MSKVLITEEILTNIANAIRSKHPGFSSSIKPIQMANKISDIPNSIIIPSGVSISFRNSASGINLEDFVSKCDFSNMTDFSSTFAQTNIVTLPSIDTSNGTSFGSIFDYDGMFAGCTHLENFPILDMTNATIIGGMFRYKPGPLSSYETCCTSLTNDSLNNIMASLLTMQKYTGEKTLNYIGLTQTQATTCQGLSNWTALSNAGWTTGY